LDNCAGVKKELLSFNITEEVLEHVVTVFEQVQKSDEMRITPNDINDANFYLVPSLDWKTNYGPGVVLFVTAWLTHDVNVDDADFASVRDVYNRLVSCINLAAKPQPFGHWLPNYQELMTAGTLTPLPQTHEYMNQCKNKFRVSHLQSLPLKVRANT
jgi:hypothetical protein